MTREDIDRIASEYFDDKESEHEMDEVFDLAKKALEKQMQEPILDKIREEIKQLRLRKAEFLTSDNKVCIDSQEVLNVIDKYRKRGEQMNDCYDCKYAIGDYEEYYGGYREHIVVGCKLDRDPDTCGEEDDEDEMPEMRK